MISTSEINDIIDKLRNEQHRDSTRKTYHCVWQTFNEFFIRLDKKPKSWEQRILLFAAYLIDNGKKSTMVKSYVSAIKAILANVNIFCK